MKPPALRVQAALDALGLERRIIELERSAHTSQQAADALGVGVGSIAKSLVFTVHERPVLVIASGANRVDEGKLTMLAGGPARRADADTVKRATGFAIGGVAIGKTVTAWGRLDIFYANAGVPQWPGAVEEVDESVFDRIMAVNVKGVFLGAKHAVPVMKKQKSGVFLITGSTAALKPRPGGQCYAASKGAVTTMTQSLALELAPFGIRVVVIAPVATETPMLPTFMGKKELAGDGMRRYVATVPLGRLNQPEDIAKAALFLASDDAAMITGSCFLVDGGRCA